MATARPEFPTTVTGRLQRGWQAATRLVAIAAPSGRVAFPEGTISDDLWDEPELAPRLTAAIATKTDEDDVLERAVAVLSLLQQSGMCGDVYEKLQYDGGPVTWCVVAGLVQVLAPAVGDGEDHADDSPHAMGWIGRPASVEQFISALRTRAAAVIEERRAKAHMSKERASPRRARSRM